MPQLYLLSHQAYLSSAAVTSTFLYLLSEEHEELYSYWRAIRLEPYSHSTPILMPIGFEPN